MVDRMHRPTAVWSATLAAAAAIACGGSTEQDLVTPSGDGRCQMSLALPESLPASGAEIAAQLSAARDCAWAARTEAAWLQLQPTSGQGATTLTLKVSENPQGRVRTAAISINDQQFALTQAAALCRFEVTPPTVTIGHQGGRVSLQLTTLEGCSWTTHTSQPWVRVVSGSGGEASGTLELAVDSNTESERSALLTVATVVVSVHQSAGPNDRSECRFSLSAGSRTIPATGGTGSFAVSTQPGCAWGPTSNQPWIVVVSAGSVIGPATVQYRVEPNPSTSSRSGAISAGTRQHVVRQDGSPRP